MKRTELLAPAGGIKQYIAAVENGADAVYLGGTLYNARMNAANFTVSEMEKAIDYGHLRGVKTYVTMNTLLTDDELSEALNYALTLYKMGADALIIQDLGLGKLIHEKMPDFPLHASTQATVYNKNGVLLMKELGYRRVVLSRELSLDEIKDCCGELEIEAFVHGALCFCYSGQCQLSRIIGGRSGNKGGCAQPCRLPYKGGESEYPLSPKDLSMLDHIGELIEAGVASFKIEGRMKSPEYVATATRIYRKYIDEYLRCGKYSVSDCDRMELAQIFNRGGFTDGYVNGDPGKALLSGFVPKNQGIYIGEIIRPYKNGMLADLKLSGPLKPGDVVEVHAGEDFTTKVTYYEELGKNNVRIGDMKSYVAPKDKVYRIVSCDLMEKAKETFEKIELDSGKYIRKVPVDFTLTAKLGEKLKLGAAALIAGKKYSSNAEAEDFTVEEAKSHGTDQEDVKSQLKKTGGTQFELSKLKFVCDEGIYVPQSRLNELRRRCLEDLTRKIKESAKRKMPTAAPLLNQEIPEKSHEKRFEIFFYSFDEFEDADIKELIRNACAVGIERDSIRILLCVFDIYAKASLISCFSDKSNLPVIPYVPNVIKGDADIWLTDNITEVAKIMREFSDKIYVGNVGHIKMFSENGFTVLADYGLNIYNNVSKLAYASLGVKEGMPSAEALTRDCGRFPLMTAEHRMCTDEITDRKGQSYRVITDERTHKSIITLKDLYINWQALGKKWNDKEENLRIYI